MAEETSDLAAIAKTTLDLSCRQLDAQLQSGDNFDTKTIGVLGFDGVALAAVLAAKDSLHGWWVVTAAGIAISALISAYALRGVNWKLGPYPGEFYAEVTANGAGPGSATAANLRLISETNAALQHNDRLLKRKSSSLLLAISALVVTAIVTSVLVGARP